MVAFVSAMAFCVVLFSPSVSLSTHLERYTDYTVQTESASIFACIDLVCSAYLTERICARRGR